jgi:hypothetical protein
MDIYFCDECATRVTDLDLRAGKGMRRRHATICAGCVDQGLAQAWLTRTGGQASASASLQVSASAPSALVASAVATADPISIARDRARTVPDDPFQVDEPAPLKPIERPSNDTDRLPSASTPAPVPPVKVTKTPQPQEFDGLASAGGGFGALMNASIPAPPPGLVDEPDEESGEAEPAAATPTAEPETPFDFVHPQDADNPGKAETAEVAAVNKADEPKSRTSSGRQQAQGKRSSTTTSKRNVVKPSSTRRASKAMGSKKLMMLTLISCGVMALIFFGLVLPNVGKSKPNQPEQINEEPYSRFKESVDTAKAACHAALTSDDIAVVRHADLTLHAMMDALTYFQSIADKRGYKEENYEELLRQAGFYDVQSMRKGVKDRMFILEQRGK